MDTRNTKGRRASAGELDDAAGRELELGAGAQGGDAGEGSAGPADAGAGATSGLGPVEVDRAAILAEAQAIADTAAPASSSTLAPAIAGDAQSKANDVAPAVRMLVAQCSSAFAPGWEITKAESDGVADAAALVMAYWIPDGVLEPKYLAIITLATSLYGVAGARRREDGSWLPLRAPREPASSSSSSSSTPATPPAPSRPVLVL